jgi:chemotaxis protein MotB
MALGNHKNLNRNTEVDDGNMDDWMSTYGDMITLLMCFFVLLLSISKPDMALWEDFRKGLRSVDQQVKTPLAEIKHDLDSLLENERGQKLVSIDLTKRGIEMQFASSTFYNAGSANINTSSVPMIDKVIQALNAIEYYRFNVDLEGHTDNVPINTAQFPSNWELSVGRATNIVRYMIDNEVDPDRLKAAGYADTRPLVPNIDSLSGEALKENQAKNRRILIRIQ